MLVTFGLSISVQFLPDPWFMRRNPCSLYQNPSFLRQYISFNFPLGRYWTCSGPCKLYIIQSQWHLAHNAECKAKGGGQGYTGGGKNCECLHKTILANIWLRQAEAQSWFPIHLPVPQGIGKTSSTDHVEIQPCDRYFDPDFYPSTYVLNGFLRFFCHESTQSREYD